MDMEMVVFHLIAHSSDAKSASMESIKHARKGDYEKAYLCIKKATESISEAHKIQCELMEKESKGRKTELSLLMVHAQDSLVNAVTIRDMAQEMVNIYTDMRHILANG